ncbi:MAG: AAA family ATPase [Methanobrevibacter sp.]|nr:AAA family ATPase [Methanobrevibacter sp.]
MESDRELLLSYIMTRLREGPLLAKKNIHSRGEKFRYRNVFIKLKEHIDNFLNGYVENRFITMAGLRGVGKSTLIFQLYDYLLKQKRIDRNRILYISTDQLNEILGESIYDTIDVFISEIHKKSPITLDKEIFIFVDEAQHDEKWSTTGKILYDQSKKIFMIFTGSSALNLEISVDAIRRGKKESIFPLNFQEYLLLKHGINSPKETSTTIKEIILTGNTYEASKKEIQIIDNLSNLKTPPKKEWENYLCYGGFPMSINLNELDIHERTYSMIERLIEKDVFHYQSFRKDTKSTIFKIITFLSLQKPGELSEGKLASKLAVSSSVIHNLLNILEKTHLIFHVNPYGVAGKTIRKPWKYYFLSPSIKASINFALGRYAPENREFLGILAENLVVSYFFKMKETTNRPAGIFYPPETKSVDFLLSKIDGEIVPVEVGIGRKGKKQVKNAINSYNSSYGIIISNKTELIKKENDVIHIPLTTFSFID